MSTNYLLVTAAKNEIERLPKLIKSVTAQTVRPVIWVLVNDGSNDGTDQLMDEVALQHSWIFVVHREPGPHHGLRYTYALRQGFDYAKELCASQQLTYEYLALVDADMILEENFFEKLIAKFAVNPSLGLASSGVYHYDEKKNLVLEGYRADWPRGAPRIWRQGCYEQAGGQPIAKSADSVANVKAKDAGWEISNFHEIKAIARASGSTKGHWAHCVYAAESAYYLHYHPILVVMKALVFLWRFPHYGIVPFVVSYLKEWISRAPRSTEVAVQDYYGQQRLKEYWQYITARLFRRQAPFDIHWQEQQVD